MSQHDCHLQECYNSEQSYDVLNISAGKMFTFQQIAGSAQFMNHLATRHERSQSTSFTARNHLGDE